MKNIFFLCLILIGAYTIINADMVRIKSQNVVIDTETKLMWQDDINVNDNYGSFNQASNYCLDLSLNGFNDWYLPNLDELKTLIAIPNEKSSLNGAFITKGERSFWSITPADSNSNYYVGYEKEGVKIDSSLTYGRFCGEKAFRCVRQMSSNESVDIKEITKKNNEAIIKEKKDLDNKIISQIVDKENGLIWQDDTESKTLKIQWRFAKEYCQNKGAGWRLPTTEELETLIDVKDGKPSISKKLKNVSMRRYWSSKQTAAFTFQTLNFHYKNIGDIDNTNEQYGDVNVRCVKNLQ